MNMEALLLLGRLWGCDHPEELTQGELDRLLETGRERERRLLQGLALVAQGHAVLISHILGGKALPEVWECFPFWTEEEIRRARLERYRTLMCRLAGQGHGEEQP